MSLPRPAPTLLALALSLTLVGTTTPATSRAQSAPTAPTPAQREELDAARADLQRAAQRLAELSRRHGLPHGAPHIERKIIRKPMLGVVLSAAEQGVLIAGVTPESAAAKAGLRSGDLLTAIDGRLLGSLTPEARQSAAQSQLADIKADTPVRLTYRRDGREQQASITPKLDRRVFVLDQRDGALRKVGGDVLIRRGPGGEFDIDGDAIEHLGDLHEMRMETRGGDCKGPHCKSVLLAEAFRWNGLNLASVDPQLGRYFGTESGVLVLTSGPMLAPLQSGDVVRAIDGKTVKTPREAMAALRAKAAGDSVAVDYLRDRTPGRLHVKVPKAMPLPLPPPPPEPPLAPVPPAPPAPPVPGAAVQNIQRVIKTTDADGAVSTVVEEVVQPAVPGQAQTRRRIVRAPAPPAPPTPPAPPVPPPPPPPRP